MNAKKMIKGILKLGVVSGIAYLAYKIGECNGEYNERIHQCADTENDAADFDFDEPDDGCIAPAGHTETAEESVSEDFGYLPLEIIQIDGVTLGQLRGLLLHLTILKTFHKKHIREYLGTDDELIVDQVLDDFLENGYISKRDKYKYRAMTNIADCTKIISW